MAGGVESISLDLARLQPLPDGSVTVHLDYDAGSDALLLRWEPAQPALSVDIGDDMWLRIRPQTRGIVGVEIEAYTRFLGRYPNLAALWRACGQAEGPSAHPAAPMLTRSLLDLARMQLSAQISAPPAE